MGAGRARRRQGAGHAGGRAGAGSTGGSSAGGRAAGRAAGVGARGRQQAGRTGDRRWADWALGASARAGLARQGQAACAALAGRARAWTRLVCWLGPLGAHALDLIFKPVFRLGIFPESPNEHCSL